MRCVECLPLIEEFFDGETDERAAEQIGAHLAACADCAAALDALSFEQEIYARYDRGLEVSPALWSAVSAEIARTPKAERGTPRRNFLSRLRDGLAATLAAFTLRPAFASALALLVVGVAVGSLWLTRRPSTDDRNIASVNDGGNVSTSPSPAATTTPDEPRDRGSKPTSGVAVAGLNVNPENRDRRGIAQPRFTPDGHTPATDDPENTLKFNPPNALTKDTVSIPASEHRADDNPLNVIEAKYNPPDDAVASAPSLDPSQKELARHVERAQMLLRSIKNARAADDGTVNVSYEKKLSRRLLAENATLQLDAETRGDSDGKQVLDRIEPFLLDIANLSDRPSREEVHSVKQRMKQNEIIASLQVY
jgi:hypothetical protein